MTTEEILALLIARHDQLSRAIAALQGIETPETVAEGKQLNRSERMKAYWAARKKQKRAVK